MSIEAPAAVEQPKLNSGARFAAALAAAPEVTPVVPVTPPPASDVPPPSSDPTPAEPVAETPAETTEPPTFIERAKALGFENLTEEDAEERVLALVAKTQEEVAQLREQAARLETERQQLLALRQPVAPVTQTVEAAKPWVPPTLDRNLIANYRETKLGADGKQIVGWKDNTPIEVKQAVERFDSWQQNWAEALTTRPHEVLTDMVKQIAAEVATKQYTEQAQTREVESFKSQVFKDNPWLFETNPLTKQATDKLSADGQRMYEYCDIAGKRGITDPREQWQYAMDQRELATFRAKAKTATTAETVAQINAQKKQATVDASLAAKGIHAPANNSPSPRSKDRPLTAGQRFTQKLAAEGVPT